MQYNDSIQCFDQSIMPHDKARLYLSFYAVKLIMMQSWINNDAVMYHLIKKRSVQRVKIAFKGVNLNSKIKEESCKVIKKINSIKKLWQWDCIPQWKTFKENSSVLYIFLILSPQERQ